MIEAYSAGQIKVDGRLYRKDVKIIHGRVEGDWWREEGHLVDENDVRDILSAGPKVLVIGTGYAGNMEVAGSLRSFLADRDIKLISENTFEATRIFNDLASRGEDVAGAFHLTC